MIKAATPARLALAAAALVALGAVGVALFRGDGTPPPPPNSQAAAAPAGDVADMIVQLEARMKADGRNADGWRMLGWAYFETGRYADSAGAYRKAVAIDPAKAEYWSALGEATVLAGKAGVTPEAAQAFRRALAVDPKEPRARYFLAVQKDMAGNHKAAVEDWIALLRDAPPGAPWAADVRQLIVKVAADNRIDVAGRVPAIGTAAAGPPPGSAAAVATAAIPGPTREDMQAAAALPPSQQNQMIQGMVEGLATRLRTNPKDPEGWIRLMRARMVLDDKPAAARALAEGRAANPSADARLVEAARTLGIPAT